VILLGIKDAARFGEVPEATIRRWITEGKLEKHGRAKPYKVDLNRVQELGDTLQPGRPRKPSNGPDIVGA